MEIKKSVTTTEVVVEYDYEEIVKLKTKMVISGASVEACDEAYHSLNGEWIAEVSYSFTDKFIDSLRDWCDRYGGCKIKDADLELCNFEPEPEPEPEPKPMEVWMVEYQHHGYPQETKLFHSKGKAEGFMFDIAKSFLTMEQLAEADREGICIYEYVDQMDSWVNLSKVTVK